MNDVLCYYLTRFTPDEIQQLFPLLALHKIRFRDRLKATPKEAVAVIFMRLSYLVRY